jgi:hypothetical protein
LLFYLPQNFLVIFPHVRKLSLLYFPIAHVFFFFVRPNTL